MARGPTGMSAMPSPGGISQSPAAKTQNDAFAGLLQF